MMTKVFLHYQDMVEVEVIEEDVDSEVVVISGTEVEEEGISIDTWTMMVVAEAS